MSGDDSPSRAFEAAARRLSKAAPLADRGAQQLARLAGLLAIRGDHDPPQLFLSGADLLSIAGQLDGTGGAADAFTEMRSASRSVLEELQRALAALSRDDIDAAGSALDAAGGSLAEVRAWPGQLATLPLWTRPVGRLVGALRDVVAADGDESATQRALRAYRRAAREASRADRALAIALSEGAGAVSQPALARLADAVSKVESARAELSELIPKDDG